MYLGPLAQMMRCVGMYVEGQRFTHCSPEWAKKRGGGGALWQLSIVTVVSSHCWSCCLATIHCQAGFFPRLSSPCLQLNSSRFFLTVLSHHFNSSQCLRFVLFLNQWINSFSSIHSSQFGDLTQPDTQCCFISQPVYELNEANKTDK